MSLWALIETPALIASIKGNSMKLTTNTAEGRSYLYHALTGETIAECKRIATPKPSRTGSIAMMNWSRRWPIAIRRFRANLWLTGKKMSQRRQEKPAQHSERAKGNYEKNETRHSIRGKVERNRNLATQIGKFFSIWRARNFHLRQVG